MVKMAKIFSLPVFLTEQHPKGLGPTAKVLWDEIQSLEPKLHRGTFEKKMFGMLTAQLLRVFEQMAEENIKIENVILGGIESHICIVQTALDLMARGYNVFVLADCTSSCNKEEVPIAISQMRQAGAVITTSESICFRLLGDAADTKFKAFSALIKEERESTRSSLQKLAFVS